MAIYEVPLSGEAQSLSIALGSVTYLLSVQWNDINSVWTVHISTASGVRILSNIPLVAGTDLLAPYAYLGFEGTLFATTDGNPLQPPTYDNLGSLGHLYFTS